MKYQAIFNAVAGILILGSASCSLQGANKIINGSGTPLDLSGKIVERTVPAGSFSSISSSRGIKVEYTPGAATTTAVLVAPSTAIDNIVVDCSDNELTVSLKEGYSLRFDSKNADRRPVLRVSSSQARKFKASSGSEIQLKAALTTRGDVEIDASSGAAVNSSFAIETAGEFEADSSSGASVTLASVKAESADADASSGSSISIGKATVAGEADFEASSGASVTISGGSCGYGEAKASSGASVTVKMTSEKGIRKSKSSGGSVSVKP